MRILVTGAGGFLGRAVVEWLEATGGHEVLPVHRKSRGRPNEIIADLTDPTLPSRLPAQIDLIVHAGAHVPEKEATTEMDLAMSTNTEATLRLLEYAVKAKARRFVYISSAAVYGVPVSRGAVAENVEPRPDNFYALSKLAGEMMLESYRFVHGIETVGLRFSYIYGKGMRDSSVIRKFASLARSNSGIPLFNGGQDYFDLIHVDDAVRAVERAMYQGSGIYNIGSGRPTSVRQLATALIAATGSTSSLEPLSSSGTYHSKYLDISKAVAELNWSPEIPLAEGLADLWDLR